MTSSSTLSLRRRPSVPVEVLSRIMFFALYAGTEFSPYMQLEDISGHHFDFVERQKAFIKTFFTVSREVHRSAIVHLWRLIHLCWGDDPEAILAAIVRGSVLHPDLDLGSLCWRLDLRMRGSYNASTLVSLMERTPNLRVFVLGNIWARTSGLPLRVHPRIFIDSLVNRNKRLQRVQFESEQEEPSLADITLLLHSLPTIVSLHVDKLTTVLPGSAEPPPLDFPCPRLEVLSLGSCIRRFRHDTPLFAPQDLLQIIPSTDLMPKLNCLYIQSFTPLIRPFLRLFGPQLKELAIASVDSWAATTIQGPETGHLALYCQGLKRLVCVALECRPSRRVFALPPHPSVQEVVMLYANTSPRRLSTTGDIICRSASALGSDSPCLISVVIAPSPLAFFGRNRWFRWWRRQLAKMDIQLLAAPRSTR